MSYQATPILRGLEGDAGPCQMAGCGKRATVIVRWTIPKYGETSGWYCDYHKPKGKAS